MLYLQLLLDAGANPNGATDHGRDSQVETPLQMAAASGTDHVSLSVSFTQHPLIHFTEHYFFATPRSR